MIRTIIPPLLALALGASFYASPSRAAEPVIAAPLGRVSEFDPIGQILLLIQPDAILTGRSAGGIGYVLMTDSRAFWVHPAPGGHVRFEPADPQKVKAMSRRQGWTI